MRILILALFSALAPAAAASSVIGTQNFTATMTVPAAVQARVDPQTHMLSLKCPLANTQYRLSRVTVLDMGDAAIGESGKVDTALVSGHGIVHTDGRLAKDCFVQDFSGQKRYVTSMRLAPNYRKGSANDWGVIKFKRMKTRNLVRYSLNPASHDFEINQLDKFETRFATARGRPENGQACQILPRKYSGLNGAEYVGVLAHDCSVIAGQSGTPFSSPTNELLGIHLGRSWMLRLPDTGRPGHRGYLRKLDADIIAEILTLESTMRQQVNP